jgi:hypothetical protein
VIAICEPECRDPRACELVTGGHDVRLAGIAPKTVQHGDAADGPRLGQMQDAVELGVLDADPDTLRWHSSLLS